MDIYKNPDDYVKVQKIKIGLIVFFYVMSVLCSGEWLPGTGWKVW